nr:hypothetical protein [Tanacetum cinerariifolium]
KSASTSIDTEKPLLKDHDGEDVDVHTYRSMIGSLSAVIIKVDITSNSNDSPLVGVNTHRSDEDRIEIMELTVSGYQRLNELELELMLLDLCKSFEKLMKDKFQMSLIGELTFFLGLQVKQKKDEIFISQDKYVAKILRKFGLTDRKSVSTPIDTEKPLLKDPGGEDVDVHTYRSMIGSLMYLTSSRPDIMFVQCKKQTVVATSSTEAGYVAAASCYA